jgi:hypothetical protein
LGEFKLVCRKEEILYIADIYRPGISQSAEPGIMSIPRNNKLIPK